MYLLIQQIKYSTMSHEVSALLKRNGYMISVKERWGVVSTLRQRLGVIISLAKIKK